MDLTKYTNQELMAICKEKQISGYSGKKKNELINLLSSLDSHEVLAKPVIKWVGGKSQILNTVLDMFPKELNHYHEPFLGGGSVLFGLLMKQRTGTIHIRGTIHASDLNLALISMYKNIQSNLPELIRELNQLISQYDEAKQGTIVNRNAETLKDAFTSAESYYYYIRKKYNAQESKTTASASAMFIFMNKTCFRGVYREGPNGFNVPFGNYSNPGIVDETHLLFISELIKDVIFSHRTYSESLSYVEDGDFIYLDPPYAPETDTSFVSYNVGGFNLADHKDLFMQIKEKNMKFVLSNSDVPIVRGSFPDPIYETKVVSCKRSKDPSAKTNEVLIRN